MRKKRHRYHGGMVRGHLFWALILCVLPSIAAAQLVRGTVLDSATSKPVGGATVVVLDPASRALALTTSDSAGRFSTRVPAAAPVRLRVQRVGHQRLETAPFVVGQGESIERELRIAHSLSRLDSVRVTRRAVCRTDPAEGSATYDLWQEIRTALELSELTHQLLTLRVRVTDWTAHLEPDELMVREHSATDRAGTSRRPYIALPPESLATNGFVQIRTNRAQYFAPDARVLLSEVFARGHCFRLREAQNDPSVIGLAFEPAQRITKPDVRGVLWVDRASGELRTLEYAYVGLPAELRHSAAGGRVDYLHLDNGAWLISRWYVRAPRPDVTTDVLPLIPTGRGIAFQSRTRVAIGTIVEEGGAVRAVWSAGGERLWPDSIAFDSTLVAAPPPRGLGVPLSIPVWRLDFDRRRRAGTGRFVTRGEVERAEVGRVSDLIGRAPGIRLLPVGPPYNEVLITTTEAYRRRRQGAEVCTATLYVDGVLRIGGTAQLFVDRLVRVDRLEALEVYATERQRPPEFQSNGCGVVVMWTRDAK